MLDETYREAMGQLGPSAPQMDRLWKRLEGGGRENSRRALRAALVAAAICAALVTTATAAYFLGAFDFLKKQDNYAALGQNEVYEKYAYEVNASAATEEGDLFTIEKVAMDGKTGTIFYSIHFQEPVVGQEEWKEIRNDSIPDLWQVERWCWSSFFTLYAGGEEVSGEGYDNSFEPQQYLADPSTYYGAWRFLLDRPLSEGETVELEAQTYENLKPTGAADVKEKIRIEFLAYPIQSERFTPNISFERQLQDGESPVEILSLERSPLGTFLTLREERLTNYIGLDFALRNADTGAYIPCGEVVVNHYGDPEGYVDNVFELYGDMRSLRHLELIPVGWSSGTSYRKTVPLSELSTTDSGNTAGGYAPISYEAKDGRLLVTMEPQGGTTPFYVRLHYGIDFLDAAGNKLFTGISTQRFKNRTDGTITRVETPDAESFQRDVDRVTQLSFPVFEYELETGRAVKIPLQ